MNHMHRRFGVIIVLLLMCFASVMGFRLTLTPATVVGNPLIGADLYASPDVVDGTGVEAASGGSGLEPIASTPQARWFTDETPALESEVGSYVDAASSAGRMPLVVLYAIPHRDCGQPYSAGGASGPAEYQDFVRSVEAGIAGRAATVILEPDALSGADCLSEDQQANRLLLLRWAVGQFAGDSKTITYVDGGHSRWLAPAELARRLRAVGVGRVQGFSLNVSNFFTTAEERAYGDAVSERLGGAHFVIDTSRNGRGPAPDGPLNWCNPPGRGLGQRPQVVLTPGPLDALLWIKRPGESDGDCREGEPPSGHWFDSYARGLIRRAQSSR